MADFNADIVEVLDAQDLFEGTTFFSGVDEVCELIDCMRTQFDNPLTPTTFRLQFPAFKDTQLYPERQVQFYIDLAGKLLIECRWGDIYKEGQALFVAHWLALDRLAQAGGPGSPPGMAVGVVNQSSVDKVSYGRDVQSVMEEGAGHWGMTTFGLQFLRLARMMGSGPIQLGIGVMPTQSAYLYANGGGGAWPGPLGTYPYNW